jgi:hypothetical protein
MYHLFNCSDADRDCESENPAAHGRRPGWPECHVRQRNSIRALPSGLLHRFEISDERVDLLSRPKLDLAGAFI